MKDLLVMASIVLTVCGHIMAKVEDKVSENSDSMTLGNRIDDLSRRPKEAVLSFHSAILTRWGNVKLEAAFDPGAARSALMPCYISQFGDSSLPFIDCFELVVDGVNGTEYVVRMAKVFRDRDAGALPMLYSIVVPARDTDPVLPGSSAIGFELDWAKMQESSPSGIQINFPLRISIRFVIRLIDADGAASGYLQTVQTEKCEIRKDSSGKLMVDCGNLHRVRFTDPKGN